MAIMRIRTEQIRPTSVTYDTFQDQLVGMSIPWVQYQYINIDGTRTVTINGMTFSVGTGQLKVYLNGQQMLPGLEKDYLELNESQIRFNEDLLEGDVVGFRIEGAGGGAATSDHTHKSNITAQGFTNGVNTIFALPNIPRDGTLQVYVNGIRQHVSTYTISFNNVTLDEAPMSGSVLTFDYLI